VLARLFDLMCASYGGNGTYFTEEFKKTADQCLTLDKTDGEIT